ncbi:hypothetical protein C4K36_5298 [Pseudomonas chlororaphis subsp. piscium]|nr:hypothetical protein C4K36_5298 [Pseudomonas chlororaphis subsp. piscium]
MAVQYSAPFKNDKRQKIQVMPLRKTRKYRDFSLNLAVYRVKKPAVSFLYCTPH